MSKQQSKSIAITDTNAEVDSLLFQSVIEQSMSHVQGPIEDWMGANADEQETKSNEEEEEKPDQQSDAPSMVFNRLEQLKIMSEADPSGEIFNQPISDESNDRLIHILLSFFISKYFIFIFANILCFILESTETQFAEFAFLLCHESLDINVIGDEMATPLMLAAAHPDSSLMELLIDHQASHLCMDDEQIDGRTIIEEDEKSDPKKDVSGNISENEFNQNDSALLWALSQGYLHHFQYLIFRISEWTALQLHAALLIITENFEEKFDKLFAVIVNSDINLSIVLPVICQLPGYGAGKVDNFLIWCTRQLCFHKSYIVFHLCLNDKQLQRTSTLIFVADRRYGSELEKRYRT